ncbi:hypothetical protein SAMN05444336_102224 [Albimonas donghaensis]|uniref:Uncharacterized protein n=1 Tax=Albimonas donghaensis TaxID=356660 RepID=A0A1H2W017_9RHOB|nr:hypothetical protein [Albimonas donghaensis]SDW73871.1 hypothetical protein SAMN05444336_102224 [Albimonas donghaensis]
MPINYISLDDAKRLREAGDEEIRQTISAQPPTLSYAPAAWERDNTRDRLDFYKGLNAVGRIFESSREATVLLILSMESILRRKGYVAFHCKASHWERSGLSRRVAQRLLKALVRAGHLTPRDRQVSKRPNTYDASQAFLDAIPQCPEGQAEGLLISDRPWQPVILKEAQSTEELESYGPRSRQADIERTRQEVTRLNQWLEENRLRIEGLDDLRFHRAFRHSLNWGGRLYGQFTSMDRVDDRPNVRIDGQPTEEADLNGSYLSFYLAMKGREDIPGDPYQHGQLAQFERAFVKSVTVRLFGRGEWWSRRYPQDIYELSRDLGYPGKPPSYRSFKEAMCATYPELEGFAEFKPTLRIEVAESRALLDTLDWLREQGEIGLPIHDGIRVRTAIKTKTEERFRMARNQAARAIG